MRVALFITCLGETFHPRAGIAAVRLLEHLGHHVEFPEDQTCCGQPMFNAGHHAQARRVAEHFVRVFKHADAIVTPSASCAAMVRLHAPALLAGTPSADAARRVAERTHELGDFLLRAAGFDARAAGCAWPGEAAYHPSCHRRALGLWADRPAVLAGVAGLRIVPLSEPEQCCGFGGTFSLSYPTISGAMARAKADALASSGSGTLICDDAGCGVSIAGACRRAGRPVRVVTCAEILAESLGLLPRDDSELSPTPGPRPPYNSTG